MILVWLSIWYCSVSHLVSRKNLVSFLVYGALVNLVSEKHNFSSWLRRELATLSSRDVAIGWFRPPPCHLMSLVFSILTSLAAYQMLRGAGVHLVNVGILEIRVSVGLDEFRQLAALRALQDCLDQLHQLMPKPLHLIFLPLVDLFRESSMFQSTTSSYYP